MSQTSEPAREGVQGQLRPGERVVSKFGPYYATSHRILLYLETDSRTITREIPYSELEGVEEVKLGNPRLMILGTGMALLGLLASAGWGIIIPLIGLAVGVAIVIYGGISRPAYYQLHSRSMSPRDIRYWRIRHHGAGSFLSSVRTITGDPPPRAV